MKTSFLFFKVMNARIIFLALTGLILFSCQSGESIADHGIIQKRKYQKGYHLNIKKRSDFDRNSIQAEKTPEDSFTESLRAEIPEKTVEPMLKESTVKESKLKPETTLEKSTGNREVDKSIDNFSGDDLNASTEENAEINFKKKIDSKNRIESQPQDYYAAKRLNIFALLSFIFAILSIFIFGLAFGIAAVVLGIMGIMQIEKNPDAYKGKGFAIVGLIIGIIAVAVMLAYYASEA